MVPLQSTRGARWPSRPRRCVWPSARSPRRACLPTARGKPRREATETESARALSAAHQPPAALVSPPCRRATGARGAATRRLPTWARASAPCTTRACAEGAAMGGVGMHAGSSRRQRLRVLTSRPSLSCSPPTALPAGTCLTTPKRQWSAPLSSAACTCCRSATRRCRCRWPRSWRGWCTAGRWARSRCGGAAEARAQWLLVLASTMSSCPPFCLHSMSFIIHSSREVASGRCMLKQGCRCQRRQRSHPAHSGSSRVNLAALASTPLRALNWLALPLIALLSPLPSSVQLPAVCLPSWTITGPQRCVLRGEATAAADGQQQLASSGSAAGC